MPPAASNEPVPLFDLAQQHQPLRRQLLAAVTEVADSQAFILGEAVERFEQAFARAQGAAHAVGLSSGTDALLVALLALGIGPGDEVITTPFTFVATAEAIRRLGARPVFADIDPATFLLGAEQVEPRIGPRTRALLPVHLFGRACPMDGLGALAERAGLALVEDCAQAQGARFAGRPVGRFGRIGVFSFFPTKNLGGWGDGGLALCDEAELAAELRALRDHGAHRRGEYRRLGGNFRLDAVQAAVLLCKLARVERWLAQRREAAERYRVGFQQAGLAGRPGAPLRLPEPGPEGEHSFGLYVVRATGRDALRAHLQARDIGCGVYYDRPLHLQACFADLGYRPGDFPEAERAAAEVLALPCYAGITSAQQQRVVAAVADFYRDRRA